MDTTLSPRRSTKAEQDAWTALPADKVLWPIVSATGWLPTEAGEGVVSGQEVDAKGEQFRRVVRYRSVPRLAVVQRRALLHPVDGCGGTLFEKRDRRDDPALLDVAAALPRKSCVRGEQPVDESEVAHGRLGKGRRRRGKRSKHWKRCCAGHRRR